MEQHLLHSQEAAVAVVGAVKLAGAAVTLVAVAAVVAGCGRAVKRKGLEPACLRHCPRQEEEEVCVANVHEPDSAQEREVRSVLLKRVDDEEETYHCSSGSGSR